MDKTEKIMSQNSQTPEKGQSVIKKEWVSPSFSQLHIRNTFGGSGDPEDLGIGLGPSKGG
jgi:hypothetical protein